MGEGLILGAIAGDIIGSIYEFNSTKNYDLLSGFAHLISNILPETYQLNIQMIKELVPIVILFTSII